MGDCMNIDYTPTSSYCPFKKYVRDCDGDTETVCTGNGYCPYKRKAKDCDGDWVEFCTL